MKIQAIIQLPIIPLLVFLSANSARGQSTRDSLQAASKGEVLQQQFWFLPDSLQSTGKKLNALDSIQIGQQEIWVRRSTHQLDYIRDNF